MPKSIPPGPVTTNPAEFKAFLADTAFFPPKTYYDDLDITFNGQPIPEEEAPENMDPSVTLEIHSGYIVKPGGKSEDIGDALLRWRETQAFEFVVVRIPKGKAQLLADALKSVDGSVVQNDSVTDPA